MKRTPFLVCPGTLHTLPCQRRQVQHGGGTAPRARRADGEGTSGSLGSAAGGRAGSWKCSVKGGSRGRTGRKAWVRAGRGKVCGGFQGRLQQPGVFVRDG